MGDYDDINKPPMEYRVNITNSQDEWEYTTIAFSEDEAIEKVKSMATEDGWNGMALSITVENLSE